MCPSRRSASACSAEPPGLCSPAGSACSTAARYAGTGTPIKFDSLEGTPIVVDNYLYQLITDRGTYHINGTKVSDYNFGIEKYLDNLHFYPQNLYR